MNSVVSFQANWNHRLVTWPIMLFVVVFIIWAIYSDIDESVRGTGKIIPSGKTKIIQHLEGGIISDILVREGDNVKKYAPLFKLSQAFFLSDKNEKKIDLYALLAQKSRLEAEISEQNEIIFDTKLKKYIPEIIANEKNILKVDRQDFNGELAVLEDIIDKKTYKIKEMQNKLHNLDLELAIAKENVTIQESLVKQGASSRQMYLTELAKKQNIVTQKQSLKNSIPVVQKELQEANNKYKNFKSKEHAKQLKELSKVKISIKKLLEKSKANEDREVRRTIKSPVNGQIKKLYFHTIGGIIKPGDAVAEITPLDDSLMVEARIKTSDRGLVWIGQDVKVEVTAYETSRYGTLEGKLTYISSDSFIDKTTSENFYEVKVKTKQSSFGEKNEVLAGMVANINIKTGKKSVLEYILKPLKDITQKSLHEH